MLILKSTLIILSAHYCCVAVTSTVWFTLWY